MGASQSSQPPSRHNSTKHGQSPQDSKHKQKAASVSTPMKQQHQQQSPLSAIIDTPSHPPAPPVVEVRSVPAVAVPIPVKKKPRSLPASGENSYVDQNKEVDLLHRLEKFGEEEKEAIDDPDVEAKFGIAWAASDDAIEDDVNKGPKRMSVSNLFNEQLDTL